VTTNKITMMQLRKEPGEYFYRRCFKGRESFVVTYQGKAIAKIEPIIKKLKFPIPHGPDGE